MVAAFPFLLDMPQTCRLAAIFRRATRRRRPRWTGVFRGAARHAPVFNSVFLFTGDQQLPPANAAGKPRAARVRQLLKLRRSPER